MTIAFYYHIPIFKKENKIYCPGFLGVFIDSLANEVEQLFLIMHENYEVQNEDYEITSKNITFISLGKRTPAWHRELFYRRILKLINEKEYDFDAIIVRSPTPLAPYFHKQIKKSKIIFMIVGDYLEGVKNSKANSIREKIVNLYLKYNSYRFIKRIKETDILVNSHILYKKYKNIAKSINKIKTTTLSINDFYYRADTCQKETIQLLYTGRFDLQKGLSELVEATAILIDMKINVKLNLVGWEENENKPIENFLLKRAKDLNIEEYLIFHGKKSIGKELNKMYQMADIYILPSYHEGFPRTIWEAMANSLPVIATDVGGIPAYLTDKKNVLLIKPKNVIQICNAIKQVINNNTLRKNLIINGFDIATDATLEIQSKKIINLIKNVIDE